MVVRLEVQAPPITPRPYGLYSAAVVVSDTDPHEGLHGISYEPESCGSGVYETPAACVDDTRPLGSLSVSVDAGGVATLMPGPVPGGVYEVNWGDGGGWEPATPPTGISHGYAAPGDYAVRVNGPDGWSAAVTVTVVEGVESGPFEAVVGYTKVSTDGVLTVEAPVVALYHLFRCRAVGRDDLTDRAEASMRLGESRALEAYYERTVLAPTAVNLTPAGGAVSPNDGVAILERYAAANYGGVPVIHARPDAVVLAHDVIGRYGIRLETVVGSVVAAGGGYGSAVGPGGVAAGPGEVWVYITGAVMVRRAPMAPINTFDLSPATNEVGVLVERVATVSHECIAGGVLVTVPEDPA